MSINDKNNEQ
jgi:hypothetical protein